MRYDSRQVQLVENPIAQVALTRMRDAKTPTEQFRELLLRVSRVMAVEVMGHAMEMNLSVHSTKVRTPLGVTAKGKVYALSGLTAFIPVVRAGLGMLPAFQELLPEARTLHVGICRNEETHQPSVYLDKVPREFIQADQVSCYVLDVMLATGGSASAVLDLLHERGFRKIEFVCVVAAPEGVAHLREQHPNVQLYAAAIDERLNERAYIVPGLGDAGDRLFGTGD